MKYKSFPYPRPVIRANNSEVTAIGIRTIKLNTPHSHWTVGRVLHTPNIRLNLTAVTRFEAKRHKISFEDGRVTIETKAKERLAHGPRDLSLNFYTLVENEVIERHSEPKNIASGLMRFAAMN